MNKDKASAANPLIEKIKCGDCRLIFIKVNDYQSEFLGLQAGGTVREEALSDNDVASIYNTVKDTAYRSVAEADVASSI